MTMTGLKLPLALGVACCFALCPALSVAADPRPEVDVRAEDGKVLIAADQIRSYDWATHTLTLAPKVRDELAKRLRKDRLVSGIPFAVTVGGKVVYQGSFTTTESSRSFSTPVIVVDAQAVEPKLGADLPRPRAERLVRPVDRLDDGPADRECARPIGIREQRVDQDHVLRRRAERAELDRQRSGGAAVLDGPSSSPGPRIGAEVDGERKSHRMGQEGSGICRRGCRVGEDHVADDSGRVGAWQNAAVQLLQLGAKRSCGHGQTSFAITVCDTMSSTT